MILLDTHVVVWLALEPARISKKARAVIRATRNADEGLAVSDMSLLEIAMIESKRRIQLNASLEAFLAEVDARFVVLPMTGQVCARAIGLPASFPKDPADRIIGSTALVHGFALVTADTAIRHSNVLETIW